MNIFSSGQKPRNSLLELRGFFCCFPGPLFFVLIRSITHMNNRFRILPHVLVLMWFPQMMMAGGPQQDFRQIESLLVELRLDQAAEQIQLIEDPGYQSFYYSNLGLYQVLSSMKRSEFASFRAQWDQWEEQVRNLLRADTLREVMLADMSAKRAIVEFIDHRYLNAVYHVRSARKYLDESRDTYGLMVEQMKLEGLFEVLLSSMPRKYKWIADPLGFSGDMSTGLSYLRISAKTCRLFNGESQLLLALIEKNILDQPETTIRRLERYQRKLQRPAILIDFFHASCLQSIKRNHHSLELLSSKDRFGDGISDFPFWDYLAGKARYFNGNTAAARRSFASFLDGYEGQLFASDAIFRIGMCWLLDGDPQEARPYFQSVVSQQPHHFDEDAYAYALAARFLRQNPGPVCLNLFRARSAYDGGYYERAAHILEETQDTYALRSEEWVEWYYRLGRILQDQGKIEDAIRAYQNSLKFQSDEYTSWIQAYSCFYLGELYSGQHDHRQADAFYQQALEYDDYFYQSGLENKCKSARSEMLRKQSQVTSSR